MLIFNVIEISLSLDRCSKSWYSFFRANMPAPIAASLVGHALDAAMDTDDPETTLDLLLIEACRAIGVNPYVLFLWLILYHNYGLLLSQGWQKSNYALVVEETPHPTEIQFRRLKTGATFQVQSLTHDGSNGQLMLIAKQGSIITPIYAIRCMKL